jgi:YVTN family beta-propeller protein
MKKLSMILTFLVIFGSSAIGHTSDECVVFEGTFEMSTRRPVAQFQYFQALDGEAILKVYDEAKDHHAKKINSATISINGKKVIRSMDFCRKKYFRFWHFRKTKFHHYSNFKQPDDVIEKTVELTKGQNSLEVMLNSMRGGKIKVAIVKPKYLSSDDSDCDFISDDGDESLKSSDRPCTGGSTALCDDNCPNDFNPDQADSDGDGIGDVCDDNDDGYPYLVKNTIKVGKSPWSGIAVSPNGELVYVTNYGDNNVSVIKTVDNSVAAYIPVGKGPSGVSVSPDGAFVYVNNYSSNSVSVIDTSNDSVLDPPIPVGNSPFGISVTPDGDYAYVSNYGSGTVSVIDTSSHAVIDTIPVGSRPWGVSVTPDGAYAYVSNRSSSTVSVIDTSKNSVIKSIFVGGSPSGITVTPDGKYVYVNNYGSGTVSVLRTSDNTVIDPPIPVMNGADSISVTPNGAYVYVNHHSVGTVSIIRTSDNTVIDTDPSTVEIDPIPVGNQPYGGGMAVSPDGKFVYVGDYTDGTVSVIGY